MLHVFLSHLHITINLKQLIMKKLFYLFLVPFFVFVSCSDDEQFESPDQSKSQDVITANEFNNMIDAINLADSNLNSKTSTKDKNENGVYLVPIYSNDVRPWATWYIPWDIPNSTLTVFVDFPQNGDDRALVFSENEFMANYTIQGPTVLVMDRATGNVMYSNYCDDSKSGVYSMRAKAEYLAIDQDGDGVTDIYLWGQPWQTVDKNFRMFVKTTLTDAHSFSGDCPNSTKEVDFSFTLQIQSGRPKVEAILDGVKYSL